MQIKPVRFALERRDCREERTIPVGCVAGARFSSRDVRSMREALDDQIAREGRYSAATLTNPSIFRIARYLLTQDEAFEVQGALTGGECEVLAVRTREGILVSAGSDHCDRELDPLFPDKPKQMCPHPVARVAWPYEEVRDHWDSLRVRSEVTSHGRTVTLQDAPLSVLVDLEYLLGMEEVRRLPDPMFLFCGAAPFRQSAADEVRKLGLPAMTASGVGDAFLVGLSDPVFNRAIEHRYRAVPVGDDYNERKDRDDARAAHH
ncbi:MAG: DUF2848 family protein [Planctomycetota bacterium]